MPEMLLVLLYGASGVAAAWEARRKGYRETIFVVLALLLGPITLLAMWLLKPRSLEVGTPVRPAAPIQLEDGGRIPPSHVTVVRDVSVVDGTVICLVTAPDRSRHWVAQEALTRVGRPEPDGR